MNLKQAVDHLSTIREQLDRVQNYRGFRSFAVGFSALAAFAGAFIHLTWFSMDLKSVYFFATWISVAIVSLFVAVVEMVWRGMRSRNRAVWKTHRDLILQILPSWCVGALLTVLLIGIEPSAFVIKWLPGIWAMIYGLGLLGCCHALPSQVKRIALFFILGGALGVGLMAKFDELHPSLLMVLLFGVGQLMFSFVLYWQLERRHG